MFIIYIYQHIFSAPEIKIFYQLHTCNNAIVNIIWPINKSFIKIFSCDEWNYCSIFLYSQYSDMFEIIWFVLKIQHRRHPLQLHLLEETTRPIQRIDECQRGLRSSGRVHQDHWELGVMLIYYLVPLRSLANLLSHQLGFKRLHPFAYHASIAWPTESNASISAWDRLTASFT